MQDGSGFSETQSRTQVTRQKLRWTL